MIADVDMKAVIDRHKPRGGSGILPCKFYSFSEPIPIFFFQEIGNPWNFFKIFFTIFLLC